MVPWIPAAIVISLVALGADRLRAWSRAVTHPLAALGVAAAVTVISAPNLGALVQPHRSLARFFLSPSPKCPIPVSILTAPDAYYRCAEDAIWTKRPPLTVQALSELRSITGVIVIIGFLVCAVGILMMAGRSFVTTAAPTAS